MTFPSANPGRPVAQVSGLGNTHQPRLAYTPASRPLKLGAENRIRLSTSTQEILGAIREERF
ncbi:hypothetical protein [Corynebacterium meitnerae]|uniref:Uncharacterized protein n=1 Tax=Corynebacterium meitnerae TaxID=2913498 RepID=A0A9X3LTJ7_9CORY|nr:hypothetical protein [Corynebacterium meitnerae]MCZ9293940.1 hypothetical protein [Corynebacterium meitnerae]